VTVTGRLSQSKTWLSPQVIRHSRRGGTGKIDAVKPPGVWFAATVYLFMMDEMTIRVAIRTTARISFVLFLGAFLGNALYHLAPAAATRWLKENKGAFTLGFAGSHTVHLAFILALVAALGRQHLLNELGWIVVVAFATGYLCLYALAAGVLFRHRTFLSSRFETLAHYYLVVLFVVGFTLSGIARPLFYTPFILVAVTAIGVRIAAAIRSRKEQVLSARA
jgi:hypothetical protein